MKLTRQIHDPYHNPFHNRFHVPVHSRLDEMQAFSHRAWLNEPGVSEDENQNARRWGPTLAAALALVLFVIFSATVLSN
jgi:hypothetical protein